MLADMTWTQWLLSIVLVGVCLFLMLVILLQRGRGGGIASAFGGGGGSGAFGAKTGDVFTWITVIVAGIFVVLAVVANYAFDLSQAPVRTPVAQQGEGDSDTKLIPIQMGDDGQALPINVEQIPVGGDGAQSVTITPKDLAPGAAPVVLPPAPGESPAAAPPSTSAPAANPSSQPPPADKPTEEPKAP